MRATEFAELRAFAQVAQRGSFARAAEHLRIAPSTLSQTVRALEERLGVTLLNRTTRRVATTSAGARLLERFAPALDEIEAAVNEARDGRARPSGIVRLHVLRAAYTAHIEPLLGRLAEVLPDVMLDLSLSDSPFDTAADGYDLVVRRAAFVDKEVVARDLGGDLRHTVVASADYLATHGTPASPTMLADHRCILWRPVGAEAQRWRFEVSGEPLTVLPDGPLVVSHCDAAIAAARQGVGIAYVLASYSAPYIATGALVPLLTDFLPAFGGWKLCHPKRTRLTAAVSGVADILTGAG